MPGQIPKPVVDSDSNPFWDGLNHGLLMLQQCQDCSQHIFYPRSLCPHCWSENVEWVQASGRGRIYTYTVVHRAFGPFAEETPFVVGIVELDEGVRMMTRLLGERDEIVIDKQVEVTFQSVGEEFTLPYFKVV